MQSPKPSAQMNLDVFNFRKNVYLNKTNSKTKLFTVLVQRPCLDIELVDSDCFVVCRQIQLQSLTDPLLKVCSFVFLPPPFFPN